MKLGPGVSSAATILPIYHRAVQSEMFCRREGERAWCEESVPLVRFLAKCLVEDFFEAIRLQGDVVMLSHVFTPRFFHLL